MRRAALVLLVSLSAGCSSCNSKHATPGAGTASANVDLAPVPAPEALVGELYVRAPNGTWKELRDLIGGPASLLPGTFPLLAATVLGLPMAAAASLDADLPMLGAVLAPEAGAPFVTIGMHVRSGRELVAQLTTGSDALYTLRSDPASGVALFDPKPGKAVAEVALGVVGNYLIAAERAEHLTVAGPFVARTLPKRTLPNEPFVLIANRQALSGPVSRALRRAWRSYAAELESADRKNREQHGGRTPDFGDPAAALAGVSSVVEAVTSVLESSEELRIIVEPQPDRLDARFELKSAAEGAAADLVKQMTLGDFEPLFALPKNSVVGISTRSFAPERAESAKGAALRIEAVFADRLGVSDKKLVDATLDALGRGRGDHTSYAIVLRGEEGAIVVRTAVSDPAAFEAGAKGIVKLLRVKAFAEPLRQFLGEVTIRQSSVAVPGLDGKVQRALMTLKPARVSLASNPPAAGSKPIDLAWYTKDGIGYVVLAREAAPWIAELVTGGVETRLASDDQVKAAAGRAGQASFAWMLQPLDIGLGGTGLSGSSPIWMSLGRAGGSAILRVEAAKPGLQALVRNATKP